jgi:hypothetical protein
MLSREPSIAWRCTGAGFVGRDAALGDRTTIKADQQQNRRINHKKRAPSAALTTNKSGCFVVHRL